MLMRIDLSFRVQKHFLLMTLVNFTFKNNPNVLAMTLIKA